MPVNSQCRSFHFRFYQVALVVVGLGVTVGLGACLFAWFTRGEVATSTLQGVLFAVVAAYPVWREYRRMVRQDQAIAA